MIIKAIIYNNVRSKNSIHSLVLQNMRLTSEALSPVTLELCLHMRPIVLHILRIPLRPSITLSFHWTSVTISKPFAHIHALTSLQQGDENKPSCCFTIKSHSEVKPSRGVVGTYQACDRQSEGLATGHCVCYHDNNSDWTY